MVAHAVVVEVIAVADEVEVVVAIADEVESVVAVKAIVAVIDVHKDQLLLDTSLFFLKY